MPARRKKKGEDFLSSCLCWANGPMIGFLSFFQSGGIAPGKSISFPWDKERSRQKGDHECTGESYVVRALDAIMVLISLRLLIFAFHSCLLNYILSHFRHGFESSQPRRKQQPRSR